MKVKRHKRVKKILNFYKNSFSFRTPYQILIDSTFCHKALKCKVNIMEQMPRYLEDQNVRLYTTPCVVMETEGLGPKAYGALHIVKQFKVRKCGHEKNSTISAEECILSMVSENNPEHLMVATTDPQLSTKCRVLPGVPLLYISYNSINLEKPSDLTIGIANKNMKAAIEIPQEQRQTLQQLKPTEEGVSIRKKRKAKGPNPLSCKKKKMKPNNKEPIKAQSNKAAKKKLRKKAKKVASLSEAVKSVDELTT